MRTITDMFGDEISEADCDDNWRSPQYKRLLAAAPDCRDPDHPGCERCEDDEDEIDPDNPDEGDD